VTADDLFVIDGSVERPLAGKRAKGVTGFSAESDARVAL
jgi:hypothetical protein